MPLPDSEPSSGPPQLVSAASQSTESPFSPSSARPASSIKRFLSLKRRWPDTQSPSQPTATADDPVPPSPSSSILRKSPSDSSTSPTLPSTTPSTTPSPTPNSPTRSSRGKPWGLRTSSSTEFRRGDDRVAGIVDYLKRVNINGRGSPDSAAFEERESGAAVYFLSPLRLHLRSRLVVGLPLLELEPAETDRNTTNLNNFLRAPPTLAPSPSSSDRHLRPLF
ncbi:hypothetical protein BJ742DRAFT_74322 [Cladochytrium replicatum]|nr:hypothetical protein BJ742DRAFT_74322 [Cladochytrium replicatum]